MPRRQGCAVTTAARNLSGDPDGEERMENSRSQPTTRLLLIDDPGLGQMHADIEAFFEFSFWLAEELEDLVARWSNKAAPQAKHPRRLQRKRSWD